ncbi:hypothetical protein [Moorena producens]|uniref:hypothetical protein n=1 Tax=Moorena producens TaxID=1155739 RepID=UPI0011EA6285|nr:hypothetical protein [Moorena producens]
MCILTVPIVLLQLVELASSQFANITDAIGHRPRYAIDLWSRYANAFYSDSALLPLLCSLLPAPCSL